MADKITTDKWVLVESGPLAGLAPTTTFHETRNAAKIYANPRKDLFSRFDLALVKYRRLVTKEIVADEKEDA
jgi:hypothetical protein